MLKNKEDLSKSLMPYFIEIGRERKKAQLLCEKMKTNYNLPSSLCSDIISTRKELNDCNELICYWITESIKPELTEKFFTKKEINDFYGLKFEEKGPLLPLKLNMLEVAADQWIGVIDFQTLMRLRREGFIHYNAATQRALKIMVRGETHLYKPYTNPKAVKEIFELIDENAFIPNTLTLNMAPDDENMDYDFKNGQMVIKKIGKFDIVDGYHRLKAFERKFDKDPDYNCNIELRIISFSTAKARQFIFQEDHKTKMPRIDIATYDQRSQTNQIVSRINENMEFDLHNQMNLEGGLINIGDALSALNKCIPKTKMSRAEITRYVSIFTTKLNEIVRTKTDLSSNHWTKMQVSTVFGNLDKPVEIILQMLDERENVKIAAAAPDLKKVIQEIQKRGYSVHRRKEKENLLDQLKPVTISIVGEVGKHEGNG